MLRLLKYQMNICSASVTEFFGGSCTAVKDVCLLQSFTFCKFLKLFGFMPKNSKPTDKSFRILYSGKS